MPKAITLYLMDDTANGRIECTLSGWLGIVYKIPRTALHECVDNEDMKYLSQPGVYILFGESEVTGNDVAYIGQAGVRKTRPGVIGRLIDHDQNPEKDYWNEAIAITTQNNSFGLTEISYLENRLCEIATEIGRYDVKNGNSPTPGHVNLAQKYMLEDFIETLKTAVGALGRKVFQPVREDPAKPISRPEAEAITPSKAIPAGAILSYKRKGGALATGQRTSEGFAVFKGSDISLVLSKSCPKYVRDLREKYADKINKDGVLTEDIPFSSPSAAATFVQGSSTSGNVAWKMAAADEVAETTEAPDEFEAPDEALSSTVESTSDPSMPLTNEMPLFIYRRNHRRATGRPIVGGFIVYKGSQITPNLRLSGNAKLRQKYADKIDPHDVLTEDIVFNSSSTAALFIQGSSQSGPRVWKTEDGLALKAFEDDKLTRTGQ